MAEPQPSNSRKEDNREMAPKQENMLANIGFNIVLPILILNKGKQWFGAYLEPVFGNVAIGVLLIAMACPIAYFVYDYIRRRKINVLSIIGVVSVLLTGGIGVLKIPTPWFAIKEAVIPLLIGLAVLLSLKTRYPLVRTLLYNPDLIKVDKVQQRLEERNNQRAFDQLLVQCTWIIALSFLISAVLNYVLAKNMVVSPSGTDAFNSEVARMIKYSFIVIAFPTMILMFIALIRLMRGIRSLTGYTMEDILHGAEPKPDSKSD